MTGVRARAGGVTVDNVRGAARLRLRLHLKGPWKSSSPLALHIASSHWAGSAVKARRRPLTARPKESHRGSAAWRRRAVTSPQVVRGQEPLASWVIESLRTVYLRVSNVGPSS